MTDYATMSALAVLSATCASTCGGPAGTSAERFLCAFVAELLPEAPAESLKLSGRSLQLSDVWIGADFAWIPYLVHAGGAFPSWLPGCCVSSVRTLGGDMSTTTDEVSRCNLTFVDDALCSCSAPIMRFLCLSSSPDTATTATRAQRRY